MNSIHENIQEIMRYCNENEKQILTIPSPYKTPIIKKSMKDKLTSYFPSYLKRFLVKLYRQNKKQQINYIIE